jgi:cytosine/uracil/thiamine/allantoin permease
MLYAIESTLSFYNALALLLFLLLSLAVILHGMKKNKKTEGLLMLATVLNYVGLNLLIYLFNA